MIVDSQSTSSPVGGKRTPSVLGTTGDLGTPMDTGCTRILLIHAPLLRFTIDRNDMRLTGSRNLTYDEVIALESTTSASDFLTRLITLLSYEWSSDHFVSERSVGRHNQGQIGHSLDSRRKICPTSINYSLRNVMIPVVMVLSTQQQRKCCGSDNEISPRRYQMWKGEARFGPTLITPFN